MSERIGITEAAKKCLTTNPTFNRYVALLRFHPTKKYTPKQIDKIAMVIRQSRLAYAARFDSSLKWRCHPYWEKWANKRNRWHRWLSRKSLLKDR